MRKKAEKTGFLESAKKLYLNPKLFRYLVVGGGAYIFEMATLYIFRTIFNLSPILSVSISFWLGLSVGFVLQKFLAFKDSRRQPKLMVKQIVLYLCLIGWNYVFTILLAGLLTPKFSVFIVRTLTIAVITGWNFLFYSWLFRQNDQASETESSLHLDNQSAKKYYAWGGLLILFATTLYWSYLGAFVHMGNADQLIDPYLFENLSVFNGAQFPAAHTFLLKWPIFFLIKLANYSLTSYVISTVFLCLATVGALAQIIRRIEKRPLVQGVCYLALSSILLMVPAQPVAGVWLPVNFAMLATRNIEYVIYLAVLVLLAYRSKLLNWKSILAAALLLLLVISDRLFLYFSLAGASLQLIISALLRQREYSKLALKWLAISVSALAGTWIFVWIINEANITQIINTSAPYGIVTDLKSLSLAIIYGFLSIVTNFGGNPVYDVVVLGSVIRELTQRLVSVVFIAFVINFTLLIGGLYATFKSLSNFVGKKPYSANRPLYQFFIMLISSSIAAIGLYVFSDHYYAVDARYLTICFIGLFFGGVIYASQKNIDAKHMYYTGIVLVISIIVGILFTTQSYQRERDALATVNKRNNQLATALESRKVDNLIGDYWRVVPTKFSAKQDLNITPLGDCNTPRDSLTSTAWQPDLSTVRFAYLLSFDEKRTDFPQCSVDEVVKNYGQPNASVLIEGTHDKPKEQLLFYDEGSSATEEIKTDPEIPTATVTPVSLDDLPAKKCQQTVMQVVAHQDDDLLFMSPDLPKAINEKKCIRTIYLTSGDGGGEAFYWLGREQGSEAAYSKMLGINTSWLYRMVKISDSQFITIASPKNHPEVSLVYLHLPDGNLRGEGFESTKLESLDKLYGEALPQINSVDSQSKYTKKDLTKLILKLMEFYKPTELRTQSGFAGTTFTDHSDHLTAGKFATEAFNIHRVNSGANLQYYLGYPVRELPENIEPEFVNIKQDAFFDYGKFDSGVCKTIVECEATPTYYDYLRRQYTFPN